MLVENRNMLSRAGWGRALGAVLCTSVMFASCASSGSKVRQLRPTEPNPELAAKAAREGRWRQAADCWYAVYLDRHGRDIPACVEAVRALLNVPDYENANSLVDAGLACEPENPELLELKARALIALGFRRPAEAHLVKALEKEPERNSALLLLGRLRIDLGLEKAALQPLEAYIHKTGGDYPSYALYAEALRASGDQRGAFQAWSKAFELGEGSVTELLAAASTCVNEEVKRSEPTAAHACRLWLERAIGKDPQCTHAHFQLGVLSEEERAYDTAIAHYRRAVETDPQCLMALTNLSILYSGRGDQANTTEFVKRALALETDADRRRALEKLIEPYREQVAGEPSALPVKQR
jgi:tetratricopeptide (TPR) repeat protein